MTLKMEEVTDYSGLLLGLFAIGYLAIVIEEIIKLNKVATALLMAVGCWAILFLQPAESVARHLGMLSDQLFKVSQVVFFILGALTIVEIINAHQGFQIVTRRLLMRSKRKLLWTAGISTFFLSAVLDNLTTTIVMLSLIQKIVSERNDRLVLGGMIVIAANAGGAWTPIGDVSTTLLWIYGQVSTTGVLKDLFLPSIIGLIATLTWIGSHFKGELNIPQSKSQTAMEPGGYTVLIAGVCSLIFIPFFKALTGLPPFMGMLFGLGIMWLITDILHYGLEERRHLKVTEILPKVDISIIFFYLGILLSINSLESEGILKQLSEWLNTHIAATYIIPVLIGFGSALVDNVSLVAATIGMYGQSFPIDSFFWQTLCYAAGTGGSILVIGSAAGIAFMSIEKVDFLWYTKNMTCMALLTFLVGLAVYYVQTL